MQLRIVKNKRGATFQAFLEVMLFSVLFVGALAIIGSNMNNLYDSDKDLSMGIMSNSTLNNLKSTQSTLESSVSEGQSSFSSLGIFTITTLPRMLMTVLGIVKDFVLGTWIRNLVELMNLGEYTNLVIIIFQILYFFLLVFVLIKLITRVNV